MEEEESSKQKRKEVELEAGGRSAGPIEEWESARGTKVTRPTLDVFIPRAIICIYEGSVALITKLINWTQEGSLSSSTPHATQRYPMLLSRILGRFYVDASLIYFQARLCRQVLSTSPFTSHLPYFLCEFSHFK
jgi:hypothetical protein